MAETPMKKSDLLNFYPFPYSDQSKMLLLLAVHLLFPLKKNKSKSKWLSEVLNTHESK